MSVDLWKHLELTLCLLCRFAIPKSTKHNWKGLSLLQFIVLAVSLMFSGILHRRRRLLCWSYVGVNTDAKPILDGTRQVNIAMRAYHFAP